jgi:hypothetical protein
MQVLDQLEELSLRQRIPPYLTATAYVALGEQEQAFGWLEKACADRDSWLVFLNVEPGVDSLRADPRFANLLHRVGPQSENNRVMEKSWTRTNGDN